jgi:NodT family efflux transporter outer membrane factor (OMF) lipoprotein
MRAGYASRLDYSLQESALAQARQQLPPLRKQLETTRDLLRVLVGATQDDPLPQQFELASLTLPAELPVSLPSQLIEQRPDVRAAEAQLQSASALVGVARANRLPQFPITAVAGGAAAHFSQMFWNSGLFFNLAGSIVQPIFDGGTLKHREKAAQAAYDEASAQYKATVLNAYQNVADALHAVVSDADALAAAMEVTRTTNESLSLIRRQSVQGYVDRLALLNAEQTHRQALLAQTQAQAARFGDTAALFQALGGGLPKELVPTEVSSSR